MDQDFFSQTETPDQDEAEAGVGSLPADLTDPAPPSHHDPAVAAITAERKRVRLRQQRLSAINMTDDSVSASTRAEIKSFFGSGALSESADKEPDAPASRYSVPQKETKISNQTVSRKS